MTNTTKRPKNTVKHPTSRDARRALRQFYKATRNGKGK